MGTTRRAAGAEIDRRIEAGCTHPTTTRRPAHVRKLPRQLAAIFAAFHALAAGVFGAILPIEPNSPGKRPPESVFIARPAAEFRLSGQRPLHIPTAVSVAPDGAVYVADGAENRIVVFAPDGALLRELTTTSEGPLHSPVSVRVDAAGRVWVADTGNARVLALSDDGTVLQRLDPPAPEGGAAADITDIAITPDGKHIWLVDNDHHRVLRYGFERATWEVFGRAGETMGQFQYPFALAATKDGDLLVSEVINARVQVLNSHGAPVAAIGSYGVEEGQLYRPKGVAVDASGNVWVVDSIMGVVQAFMPSGDWLDVLHAEDGQPLRLKSPTGLAFDAAGALYIVEAGAGVVRKFAVERTGKAPRLLPARRDAGGGGAQQARGCTTCHLEWLPPFSDDRDSSLMPNPGGARDDPNVARQETCLSCHDAGVVDSRRRVWSEHGHRTGVAPPETIKVPANLPLVNGKLACRTCHSAHGSGADQGDMKRAVLLRVTNVASQLCVSCHGDKTRGPQFGTHPTGGMPWPVPKALVEAGSKVGPDPRELTCQVCHTPHGAQNEHLLVMGTTTNQLCVTCHDQMRPGMFRQGGHMEHPLTPLAKEEQIAAVRDMGTQLSPDGKLICLSCHKLHHGKGAQFLLAEDLSDGQLCLKCHSERAAMAGSAHDLRQNFPEERNRLGMTPASGGPCSACHLFHRYAREMTPGPSDPSGKCLTCHSPGKCAQNKVLASRNHPTATCTDCHNPHETRFGKFLPAKAEDLCVRCHAQNARVVESRHHAARDNPAWTARGVDSRDHCLTCHRPHGDEKTGLFRVAVEGGATTGDAVCAACHSADTWGADGNHAALHPQSADATAAASGLPLVTPAEGEAPRIGCRTCHDPHGGESEHLLRGPSGRALCIKCHSDMQQIEESFHASAMMSERGFDSDSCRPCHAVHGNCAETVAERLWPRSLLAELPPLDPAAEFLPADDAICMTCHGPGGKATHQTVARHPNVAMFNPYAVGAAGGFSLYDADGKPSPNGTITCRTCHLPHGREPPDQWDGVRHAAQLQVRPFVPPNLCTTCHGAEALRRYLYFHDPSKRAATATP